MSQSKISSLFQQNASDANQIKKIKISIFKKEQ